MDMTETLRNSWMIVRVETRSWGGTRTDKTASSDAARAAEAAEGAVRVVKHMLHSAKRELDAVSRAQGAMRDYLERVSVPWPGNKGARLVPTSKVVDVLAGLGGLQGEVKEAVEMLRQAWPDRVQQSCAALGTLADPTAYPTEDAVPSMYGVTIRCEPLPSGTDYSRLTLPPEVATALAERLHRDQEQAVKAVRQDTAERLVDVVNRLRTTIDKKIAGEKTRLTESPLEEMASLTALVKELDTTGKLGRQLQQLEQVQQIPLADLREKQHVQKEVKVLFDEVAQGLEGAVW